MNISLIITTYNWPDALEAVLNSIQNQTLQPYEVIIADDGSKPETTDLIQHWQTKSTATLKHVWQPDAGFQAAKIRNKAILQTTGDYLIFIDGDCILRQDFVEKHNKLATKGFFVAGNRALLSKTFTTTVLERHITPGSWQRNDFTPEQINRSWPIRYLPLGPLRRLSPKKWHGVKTCNLAAWKTDILNINGFDEAFIGWGYEDSELVIRLLRHGVKHLSGRFATTVLHLWHHENDRSQQAENWTRLQEVINSDKREAHLGLKQQIAGLD